MPEGRKGISLPARRKRNHDYDQEMARLAQVVALRRSRHSFDEIATQLGVSSARAHQLYKKALTDHPLAAMEVDAHRIEEAELCDIATQHLMAIALTTEVSPRTRVEAWSTVRGWAERKAKLLGLDCPTEIRITTISQIDAQIAALESEITTRARVIEGGEDILAIAPVNYTARRDELLDGDPAGEAEAFAGIDGEESGAGDSGESG